MEKGKIPNLLALCNDENLLKGSERILMKNNMLEKHELYIASDWIILKYAQVIISCNHDF